MDPEGGSQSVENMRKAGNGQGRMYIVPHAGHHRKCFIYHASVTNIYGSQQSILTIRGPQMIC